MKPFRLAGVMLALCLMLPEPVHAGFGSRAAQELTEFVMKKFGRKVAQEGAETLAGKLTSAVARHGDDMVAAVRKVGPAAMTLADDAGKQAPSVIRLLTHYGDDALRVLSHPKGAALVSRYGDDAAAVLIRHKGVAEPVLERLGAPAIKALGAVSPQGGRRLAMMAGDFTAGGRTPELLGVVGKYGDNAMEFLWKHKGVLAGSTALAAFLTNPEPYLSGSADLAQIGAEGVNRLAGTIAENVVKPAVVATGNVAVVAASFVRQVLIVGLGSVSVVVALTIRSRLCRRVALRMAGKQVASAAFGRK